MRRHAKTQTTTSNRERIPPPPRNPALSAADAPKFPCSALFPAAIFSPDAQHLKLLVFSLQQALRSHAAGIINGVPFAFLHLAQITNSLFNRFISKFLVYKN